MKKRKMVIMLILRIRVSALIKIMENKPPDPGVGEWCRMVYAFVDNTKAFLQEYFQRNQSESGFSEDKKRTGWRLTQKREERIDTAYGLTTAWHNLFWVGA